MNSKNEIVQNIRRIGFLEIIVFVIIFIIISISILNINNLNNKRLQQQKNILVEFLDKFLSERDKKFKI